MITAAGLQLAIQIITLVGIGITIGMVRANYVTQKQLAEHEVLCWKNIYRMFDEVTNARRDIWAKIDKIYEHLLKE